VRVKNCSVVRVVPVIGLAVRWWDAGEGSGEAAEPPPQVKNIFYIPVQ